MQKVFKAEICNCQVLGIFPNSIRAQYIGSFPLIVKSLEYEIMYPYVSQIPIDQGRNSTFY